MSRKIKVILSLAFAVTLAFAMWGCGSEPVEESGTDGVANPVHESDADGVMAATDISLEAPEGATDVAYSYIDAVDEDRTPIAQVSFTLDGNSYNYRAQMTNEINILGTSDDPDANLAEQMEKLSDGTNAGAALAGLYSEWKTGGSTMLSYCDAVYGINDGDEGFIAWLDVVPGIMYSLSMDDNASQSLLQDTAAICFVPAQGDSDGDADAE